MPTNKYGYLQRISNNETSDELTNIFYEEFQGGGERADISFDFTVEPLASFEQDRFKLDNSKYGKFYLAEYPEQLNHITVRQSNEDGVFTELVNGSISSHPVRDLFSRRDGRKFFENGITIVSSNYITSLEVRAWSRNTILVDTILTDKDSVKTDLGYAKKQTFFVNLEGADRTQIGIISIDKPFNFFYLFNLNVGIEEEFKDDLLLSVSTQNNVSIYGDTLEYSTLDFEIKKDGLERLFQRKEKIQIVKDDGKGYFDPVQGAFFTREITETNHSVSVSCEDVTSLFEANYLGGVAVGSSVRAAIELILGEELMNYCTIDYSLYDQAFDGYLPICTKREALQQLLLGCNIRKYKYNGIDSFSPFRKNLNTFVYDKTKIIENPQIIKNQPLKELRVRAKKLTQSKEPFKVYEGNALSGEKIFFDEPIWALEVYKEISDGNWVKVDDPSKYLEYDKKTNSSNVVTFVTTTAFEIVVKAYGYYESIIEKVKNNPDVSEKQEYSIKTVELSVYSDVDAVCELLYELYSRPVSIRFKTLHEPILGELYEILGYKLNIKSVKENLDGVFEVEAC